MSNAIQVPFMKKPILCRDLSNRYAQLRRSYYASSAYGNVDEEEEIELHYSPSTNLNSGAAKDMESGMDQQWAEGTSPLWYRVLTQVKIDIDSIKKYMEQLSQMHKQHCTFSVKKSNNFAEEERQIEILTEDIKRLFVRCKQYIERIVLEEKPKNQEDVIKRNTKSALVMELNELSKQFREQQQDYLQKLKALKQRRQNVMLYKSDNQEHVDEDLTEEEKERIEALEQKQYDPGFTDEQIQMLIQNERENIRRDKELREILTSIVELNELFKEFSALVVEQGSLLDRIDHNIEQTFENVKQGNKELAGAEKYQKCGTMAIIILILAVVLLIAVVAIILKVIVSFTFL
ncbi:hypothetical protein FDP41_011116 [Naegleria fowleri]|uniref:Syntaxin-16a n=1 Tax=Naegleria fowleri TaxID=5763 RepID=A0A2P1N6S5_NAEFO|nr:uncharacterized protein FDP41_011116 [Naegleria fowleri]AVP49997.1 syntaxin-16a [Naegleria fowleri]KAF0983138.1 hypothetical protein FDP41_011116 [Naegleria fowleri]CAG4713371.1 unnamed protein product [Naegleria fowleri]